MFFDFLERFGDLLRYTCGPFRNSRKKREKLETSVATPTNQIAYSDYTSAFCPTK